MSTAIIPGSLGAIAQKNNVSIAETFVNADAIIIVDTSGSMDAHDSRGGRSRYEVACEELTQLQNTLPGKIAVIAFSTDVMFCPNGIPTFMGGRTDLTKALTFTKIVDIPGIRFIVISDGEPDDCQTALSIARTYKNKIDVIYVGPEEHPRGRDFLQQLAKVSGGIIITADKAQGLLEATKTLLLHD
ncbi:VWA domain-containing protein [Candidatus Parcubacteria bacterium]|jgi:hypothetical protein|nr:MAG: VWA domain-containing protein [Candidatus Parcubacteria bacterium]